VEALLGERLLLVEIGLEAGVRRVDEAGLLALGRDHQDPNTQIQEQVTQSPIRTARR
jgi:hypothetical protein